MKNISHIVATLAFLLSSLSFAQSGANSSKGLELECRYLYAIEQVFLSQHIKFSQRDQVLQDRVVEQYIKKLDPTKVNLLASDAEEIKKSLANIFDDTKKRDCSPLDNAEKIVFKRIKERAEYAKKVLGKDFKYDPKVEFVFDPQKKPFPATDKEANDFLKKYIQFQISNYLAADQKLDEAKSNVVKSWDRNVKRTAEEKADDNYAMYLDAFALALDPHSSYFSRDVNEDFRIQMSLSLEGIGATLSSQDGFTVIEALVPGGAAARSGLVQAQDKIVAVAQGDKGAMENVIEMDLRDVVKKIRGSKGTKVRLMILRKDGDKKKRVEVTLVRDQVKLDDEAAAIHYLDREVNGVKKKIAVLELPSFYSDSRRGGRSSAADLKKLVAEARAAKADAAVLDLANNGGGSLEDAVKIAGLFFATGNVVKQSTREDLKSDSKADAQGEIPLKDSDPTVDWPGPLVVLTSRISASASEIVSGTLKDYKRALIVGSAHTFGKGSVQTVQDIPPQSGELGAVKVTVGMFFTPGGFSTQHRGVEADVVIPGPYDQDDIGEKYLDYSLPPKQIPEFISPEAYVKEGTGAWLPIQGDWIKGLAEKSKARVAKSTDFKKIIDDLNKEKARGKLIKISDSTKDKEKRESKKAAKNAGKEDKEKDYLKRADVQEAVSVAADLLAVENTKAVAKK
jgi:carboxyl-terminal processing protease